MWLFQNNAHKIVYRIPIFCQKTPLHFHRIWWVVFPELQLTL
eukprot:Gb_02798 [translate_table: standard]